MPKGAIPKCKAHLGADFIQLPPGLILTERRPFSHWVKLMWSRTWLHRDTPAAD